MANPHWTRDWVEPMPLWLKSARSVAAQIHRRGDCSLASLQTLDGAFALIEADDLPSPIVGAYGTNGLTAVWAENTRRVLLIAEGHDVRWLRFSGVLEQRIPTAYRDSAVVLARENLTWLRGGSLYSPSAFTKSILEELAKGGRLL